MLKGNTFGLNVESGRLLILLLTIAACVASALYFVLLRGIVEAHTHIFYAPIVLAGMWYHKKAVYVALFLGLVFLLGIHFSPLPICIYSVARTATFLAIAYLMGYLSNKRAEGEEELAKSKAYTESIIENFLDTLIVVDAEAKLQVVNPATCHLLGYTEEEVIGQPVGIIFAEKKEEVHRVFQFFREPEKAGAPRPQDTIRNRELTYKTKDGRLIPMLFNASVLTDEGGSVTGVVAGAKDITELRLAATALRREKIFSQNIVATVPETLLVLDKGLRIKSANRTFYEIFQTEPEKVIGSSITDVLLDEDGRLSAELTRLFGTGDMLENLELHYRSEILGERIFSVTARGMLVEEEEEEEELVALQDITQRKRAEEALLESEEKYRNLIDQSQDVIYLLHQGKFELINKRFEELFGYTLEEVNAPDFHFMNLVAPQSRAMVKERTEKVARGERVPPLYEFTILTRDGAELEVETSVSHIQYKEGIAAQGILRDVTERKRAEEELQQSHDTLEIRVQERTTDLARTNESLQAEITERIRMQHRIEEQREYLASVLHHAPDAIITVDSSNRIVGWNPGAERLLGYSHYEVYGKNIDGLVGRPDVEEQLRFFTSEAMSGKGIPPTEVVRYRKNGDPVDVIVSISPIMIGGRAEGGVVIYTDITERKWAEEKLRAKEMQLIHAGRLSSLGEMATGVAHEINQPLAIISLAAEGRLRDIYSGRFDVSILPHELEDILKNVGRIDRIITHMRTFARRAGESKSVEPEEVLDNVFILLGEQFRTHQISVSHEIEEGLPAIKVDANQLEQVFVNILTNARQVLDERAEEAAGCGEAFQKRLVCSISRESWEEHEYVVFEFADNAFGVPDELKARVFDPFLTTKEAGQGTGLGLSIAYSIVTQALGGKIWVDDNEMGGATFKVELPVGGEVREQK